MCIEGYSFYIQRDIANKTGIVGKNPESAGQTRIEAVFGCGAEFEAITGVQSLVVIAPKALAFVQRHEVPAVDERIQQVHERMDGLRRVQLPHAAACLYRPTHIGAALLVLQGTRNAAAQSCSAYSAG